MSQTIMNPGNFPPRLRPAAVVVAALLGGGCLYWYQSQRKMLAAKARDNADRSAANQGSGPKRARVAVDKVFLKRLVALLKVLIPHPMAREVWQLLALTGLLMARTSLTLKIADMTGKNAESLVARKYDTFVKGVIMLGVAAVPASVVNSGIKYVSTLLQLNFRQRLSRHLHQLYLNGMSFYRASNVGSKIDNIDQRITQDTQKFADSFSSLYSSIFKPVMDVILLTRRLANVVGLRGPLMMYLYYFLSAILLRVIMPPFAKLTADQQKLEGDFRYTHSRLINYAEEVAFYGGNSREKNFMNSVFDKLYNHSASIFKKQAYLGVFDSWLVKYGATMIGYAVVALPVFSSLGVRMYGAAGADGRSKITRDYVRNSSILINLARAIGQLILLYKTTTQLAGYTARVAELREVLIKYNKDEADASSQGALVEGDHIAFQEVSIVSPDNVVLLDHLNFEVKPGDNTLIVGPNGCGKSSLFRLVGGLWPIRAGRVTRPSATDMFYIPQRPYLTTGTLRQQIIYPHSEVDMARRGVDDAKLLSLMEEVEMRYLVDREGWDKELDWDETLSQGEQQRVAMARLFYHSPKYAILDECTSQLSLDIEAFLYQRCGELGITLITVAHRKSLWKYHKKILIMSGIGTYVWRELEAHEVTEENQDQGFNTPARKQ